MKHLKIAYSFDVQYYFVDSDRDIVPIEETDFTDVAVAVLSDQDFDYIDRIEATGFDIPIVVIMPGGERMPPQYVGKVDCVISEETVNKRLKKAVKLTGLKPYINENPYNLSYSYRKFVTIAAAIAADPDVFVFDEPTACQDRHGIRLLSGIINALSSEGKLVITITHDMEFVAENFDRTVCMADKHILMDDKTNRILTDDSLMEKAALKKPNVSYLASEMGFEGVITSEDFLAALTENSKRL